MCDTYENYIGRLIKAERIRRGLKITEVCDGICSVGAYAKLEAGEYAGGIHVLRAICQRLGMNIVGSAGLLEGDEEWSFTTMCGQLDRYSGPLYRTGCSYILMSGIS